MKKCSKFVWVAALLVLLAAQPGCMTLDHLLDGEQDVAMYGGTTSSYLEIEDVKTGWFGVLCRIIDLPLTIAADTILLPITAPVQMMR